MYEKIKYYISLVLLVITLGCENKKTKSLPESMSQEEITSVLPSSVKYRMGDVEKSIISKGLVDVQGVDNEIRVDLKYSTTDNFFGENVYGSMQAAYLQSEVAAALAKANQTLIEKNPNLRLIIFDAARPVSIQKILWKKLDSLPVRQRKSYVADPRIGSIHNYGCAVDLSIINIRTGKPLDMGTTFDYFGEEAYPRLEKQMINQGKLNPIQISNREILRSVMIENGFSPISSEWWHFNYFSREIAQSKYKIID